VVYSRPDFIAWVQQVGDSERRPWTRSCDAAFIGTTLARMLSMLPSPARPTRMDPRVVQSDHLGCSVYRFSLDEERKHIYGSETAQTEHSQATPKISLYSGDSSS
jgi:hypothetical protein